MFNVFCTNCGGAGKINVKLIPLDKHRCKEESDPCPKCGGRGYIHVSRSVKPLKIKLDPGATMPTRAHATDAGLDLYAAEDVNIWPHSWQAVETGVHVAIPEGYVGLLTSKSGLMRSKGMTCRGTIDSGYTGTIQAVLFNHSDVHIRMPKGNKVTQLVIMPIITPDLELVEELEETERGGGGFGSTGK